MEYKELLEIFLVLNFAVVLNKWKKIDKSINPKDRKPSENRQSLMNEGK